MFLMLCVSLVYQQRDKMENLHEMFIGSNILYNSFYRPIYIIHKIKVEDQNTDYIRGYIKQWKQYCSFYKVANILPVLLLLG